MLHTMVRSVISGRGDRSVGAGGAGSPGQRVVKQERC